MQVGVSAEVDKQLVLLRERVMLELRLQHELLQLQGMLEPILASSVGPMPAADTAALPDLQPLSASG